MSYLTGGRLLARNTLWNVLGQMLPMGVAVIAIPALVRGLGMDRFGLLSLAWIAIGYLSLFDLGIGRALTQLASEKLSRNEEHLIPPLAWTSLFLMLVLGAFGGLITAALSPWLIHRALRIPAALQPEALHSFYLVAASVPLVTLTAGFRGILEALQRFRLLNLIRIPMSVFSFAGPLLALPFSRSLTMAIGILVGGRLIGLLVHALACFLVVPSLRRSTLLSRSTVLPVVKFGGWMTVSNIIGPIMVYMDRFLIGSLLSMTQVTYYSAPFDVITRLSIIPGALSSVLFPAFTLSLLQDPERTALLFRRGVKYLFLAIFPIVLVIVAFAPEGLRIWLGPQFSPSSSSVLRWLAAGVFVNAFAFLPFTLIQSAGRPDRTAKLHLIELPVYLLALLLLVRADGIVGAAIAWTGRLGAEAVIVFWMASHAVPHGSRFFWKLAAVTGAGLLLLYLAALPYSTGWKIAYVVPVLLIFAFAVRARGLTAEERTFLARAGASDRA
jgi:O-antigen/teichoic acid export membrane protein